MVVGVSDGEWEPPISGKVKINFDEDSLGNPRQVGCGCVLRDSQGRIMAVKGGHLTIGDAMFAEVMGLLEIFRLFGCLRGRVSCPVLLKGILKRPFCERKVEEGGLWSFHHFICKIKDLLRVLQADVVHIPRDRNALTDKLAKWKCVSGVCF